MIRWPFVAIRLRPRSARLRCAAFAAGTRPPNSRCAANSLAGLDPKDVAVGRARTAAAEREPYARLRRTACTRPNSTRRSTASMVARAMTLPGALLLDLDDTILDAYGNRDAAWRPLCAEFARLLGTVTADELRAVIIESATWVWSDPERARRARLDLRAARRMVVRGAFTHLGIGNTPVADTMADRFSAVREAAVKPFPGAIDTLRRLRDANVRLALLTNGAARSQRAKIARFGLERSRSRARRRAACRPTRAVLASVDSCSPVSRCSGCTFGASSARATRRVPLSGSRGLFPMVLWPPNARARQTRTGVRALTSRVGDDRSVNVPAIDDEGSGSGTSSPPHHRMCVQAQGAAVTRPLSGPCAQWSRKGGP